MSIFVLFLYCLAKFNGSSSSLQLLSALCLDLLSCDLQVSLFCCASKSYRHSSALRPFPKEYEGEDGEVDEQRLVRHDMNGCDKQEIYFAHCTPLT